MKDVLRSKGLYLLILGKEKSPIGANKKSKWDNKNGNTCGLIEISISCNLWYHIQWINDLDVVYEKIKKIFGEPNVFVSHYSKSQIMTLSPNDFSHIQVYLSMFKTLSYYLQISKSI